LVIGSQEIKKLVVLVKELVVGFEMWVFPFQEVWKYRWTRNIFISTSQSSHWYMSNISIQKFSLHNRTQSNYNSLLIWSHILRFKFYSFKPIQVGVGYIYFGFPQSFIIFCDGSIKDAHCKRDELWESPQLVNKNHNVLPCYNTSS